MRRDTPAAGTSSAVSDAAHWFSAYDPRILFVKQTIPLSIPGELLRPFCRAVVVTVQFCNPLSSHASPAGNRYTS